MSLFSCKCCSTLRLVGKTVVITRANSGIGRETTRALCRRVGNIHFDDINLKNGYTPSKDYAQSKLANVLFTRELARRLKGFYSVASMEGQSVYSLHPGINAMEIGQHFDTAFFHTYFATFRSYLSKDPISELGPSFIAPLTKKRRRKLDYITRNVPSLLYQPSDELALHPRNESLTFVDVELLNRPESCQQ